MLERGDAVARVERWFSDAYGAAAAVATGSGCQALLLALRTLNIGRGDEVIVPSYVCPEVMDPVRFLGARIVFVDSADDYLPDATRIADAIGPRTRAILFPYLFGIHRSIEDIRGFGIPVIEDCAHFIAPGVADRDIVGDLAMFSFKATKLVAGGEGGLLLTRSASRATSLREAASGVMAAGACGLFSLSDLTASLIEAQLARYDRFAAARRRLAATYTETVSRLDGITVAPAAERAPVPYRLPLLARDRLNADRLIADLGSRGIAARRPVDPPCHRLLGLDGLEQAERLCDVTVSLPLYPAITDSDANRITDALSAVAGAKRR